MPYSCPVVEISFFALEADAELGLVDKLDELETLDISTKLELRELLEDTTIGSSDLLLVDPPPHASNVKQNINKIIDFISFSMFK